MGELLFWTLYPVVQVVVDIFAEICQGTLAGMWYHITGRY